MMKQLRNFKIPKPIVAAVALGLISFDLYPQTFANLKEHKRSEQLVSGSLKLRDAVLKIKSRFQVNILFEEQLLEGLEVDDAALDLSKDLQQNLASILEPNGLTFQRLKKNSYVILDKKNSVEENAATADQSAALHESVSTKPNETFGNIAIEEVAAEYYGVQVSGTIKDENGEGLPGVNILEKGTSNGTTSDINGNYTLFVQGDNATLLFSFIGYQTKEVPVGTNTTLDVSLALDVTSLNEVVVIGYGEKEKKDITGAISNMNSDEIVKSVSVTPELAMQGRMTGVFVSSPGGNPNARPTVRIRGVSTFNNANPLYVVDGVPIFEFGGGNAEGAVDFLRGGLNPLTTINPGDIESISVLKDAAASAIYGSRAANGVILITTKRGKAGKMKVEVNASRGVQSIPNKYDMLNTEEYTNLYQEMIANKDEYDQVYAPNQNPNSSVYNNFPYMNVFNPNSTHPYYRYLGNSPTYDWQDQIVNNDAVVEDYSVRVSGGNESSTYYVGGGYSRTESPLINNNLERFSLSSNIQSKISKVFEVGVLYRVSYVDALDNTSGSLQEASHVSPWQPIYDPNDPTGFARTTDVRWEDNPSFDLSKSAPGPKYTIVPGSQDERPWGQESNNNMFAQMALRDNRYGLLQNFGNVYLQISPLNGLKIKGGLSIDYTSNLRKEWFNFDESRFSETPQNWFDNQDGTAKGQYTEREIKNFNFLKDITISYQKSFGDHNIDLLVNASDQSIKWKLLSAASPISFSEERFRRVGAENRWTNAGSDFDNKALQGYVFRASYNYKSKYYLDASYRRDGSSEFAPDYRWGNFPGVSAAWRISEENFFRSITFIDDLKLRAGYGSLGNSFNGDQGYTPFAYLSTVSNSTDYSVGSGNGNGYGTIKQGAYLPKFPNFVLTWETAKTFNVGLDAAFLAGKVNATIEYYDKRTDDIIQAFQLPYNTGIKDAVQYNVANVRNSGIELELGFTEQFGDVRLNISGNLTTVRNRVTEMYNNVNRYDRGLAEGYPIGFIWGQRVGGIFQNQEEIDAYRAEVHDGNGAVQRPGDMWFQNLYGNPTETEIYYSSVPDTIVNEFDRTYIGKTIPGYYYGFTVNTVYKGFDLSVFLQGVGDVQKYNSPRNSGELLSGSGLNMWASVKDRWTPENPSSEMPRAIYGDPNGNARYSDRFVENAGFLRLKNVQLGYTLPSSILTKLNPLQSLRVYASGTNLFTFTKWTGIDPENDYTPPTRVISIGLNASF